MERMKRICLYRKSGPVFFLRTYDQQEIDLVEEQEGKLTAFEFKYGDRKGVPPKAWATAYPEAAGRDHPIQLSCLCDGLKLGACHSLFHNTAEAGRTGCARGGVLLLGRAGPGCGDVGVVGRSRHQTGVDKAAEA
jgi:hypothetical protein